MKIVNAFLSFLVGIIAVLSCYGCFNGAGPLRQQQTQPLSDERDSGSWTSANYGPPTLPPGARNVQELGNGWCTFDIVVNGRLHTVLFVRYETTHGYAVGAFTELADPK